MEKAVKNELKELIEKFAKRNKLPQPNKIKYNCHTAFFNINGNELSLSYEHKKYGMQWTGDLSPTSLEEKKYLLTGRLDNQSISLEAHANILTIYPHLKITKKGNNYSRELIPSKPRTENQRADTMNYWFLTPPNIQ